MANLRFGRHRDASGPPGRLRPRGGHDECHARAARRSVDALDRIFFEFKEFGALFTLPLTVVTAFILWSYGAQVLDRPWLRYTVAVLMGLAFFYLVIAFGLGAAVTKPRPA